MPGHSGDSRTAILSGEYRFIQKNPEGKTRHRVSIDWDSFAELDSVEKHASRPKFLAWLRTALAIPDDEFLEISTDT